tara:strand:- start:198 stop:1121 length:924 start_codon:yes stop_codon:yes gene_type:complete
MFCDYSDKKSIDSLVAKKKLLQKQLISGRRYVDPSDDPSAYCELNNYYTRIKCLKDTLKNIEDAIQMLKLTNDGINLLKQINRKINHHYSLIIENIMDDEHVYTNFKQILELSKDFFTTAQQFKYNNISLFDLTGHLGIMQWDLGSKCCNIQSILDWQRPVILSDLASTQIILSSNIVNIYFYRNNTTLDLYIKPEIPESGFIVSCFSADKDIYLSQVEKNSLIVNLDYTKLVQHSSNISIMIEKINIRKELLQNKLCNLEQRANTMNSIDVDKIQHEINCINKQLNMARKVYVNDCCYCIGTCSCL